MRTATAITLVLLGGGATVMAVHALRQCKDPETGQEVACANSHYSGGSHYTGSHYYWSSSRSSSGYRSSSASGVSRGGFGASGASFHSGGG